MGGPRPNNFAHTSTGLPEPPKQSKNINKRARQGHDFLEKICLADGRTTEGRPISCDVLHGQAVRRG